MLVNVRGRSFGTATASWLRRISTREPSSRRPADATVSICASSALTNTSTGAPSTIWRASTLDPAKLNRTDPSASRPNASPTAVRTSVRLAAAETVTIGAAGSPWNAHSAAAATHAINLIPQA